MFLTWRGSSRGVRQIIRRGDCARGFTLIELLIVLAIVGLLTSLVTPAIQSQFDRARAEEEWLVMRRELERLSWQSFLSSSPVEIRLADAEMTWSAAEAAASGSKSFFFLSFPEEQRITIDEVGYASPAEVVVMQGKRRRVYVLNKWVTE